jgi:hypothetical protein
MSGLAKELRGIINEARGDEPEVLDEARVDPKHLPRIERRLGVIEAELKAARSALAKLKKGERFAPQADNLRDALGKIRINAQAVSRSYFKEDEDGADGPLDEATAIMGALHDLQDVQTRFDAAIDKAVRAAIADQKGGRKIEYTTLLRVFLMFRKTAEEAHKRILAMKKRYPGPSREDEDSGGDDILDEADGE